MTKQDRLQPIKPDHSKPWVVGYEYVSQEGSGLIERLREERGWTQDEIYELSDWTLDPNTLGLIEGEYGVGMPFEIEHLVILAILFDTTPGALLDRIYIETGERLIADE